MTKNKELPNDRTPKGEWSICGVWNDSLVKEQKELKARTHIHAGEIGKSFYERWQKMQGVQYTEGFDDRTLRKFAAGNIFEDLIGFVLKRIGILVDSQGRVEIPESDKHLKVTGYLDYVAGGVSDWKEARDRVASEGFPEAVEKIALNLIDYFEEKYPKGLEEIVYEIKSVNSQVFWAKKEYLEEAYPHHVMQLYTYLKGLNKPKGRILYISKDDMTLVEIPIVYPTPRLEKIWSDDVEQMTKYIRDGKEPPTPDWIVYDKRKKIRFQKNKKKYIINGCYVKNWEIDWSPYFSLITDLPKDKWELECRRLCKVENDKIKEEYIKKHNI